MLALQVFGDFLDTLLSYLQWLIFFRILFSYLTRDYSNPIYRLLYALTEPFLEPFRKLMPKNSIGLDFSPILCFLFLSILQELVRAF